MVDLPEPDSPDQADGGPARHAERDAVDGDHATAPAGEVDGEVVCLDESGHDAISVVRGCRQRTSRWVPFSAARSGSTGTAARAQSSWAAGQRGWKRQPPGHWPGAGTAPAITGKGSPGFGQVRRGPQQGRGVGVAGAVDQVGHGGLLHDLARVHHDRAVAQVGEHPPVVADQDEGRAAVPQPAEQVEDLGLHGDVQGSGRLVGDDHVWVAGDRGRDPDPLGHAAGELVRVGRAIAVGLGQPHQGEQLAHPRPDLGRGASVGRGRAIASASWNRR